MSTVRQEIGNLFWVGDIVSCTRPEDAFSITAIHDDRVEVTAYDSSGPALSIDYSTIEAAIQQIDVPEQVQIATRLNCFAREFLRRAEEAKRDAEVDAMWRSAMVCQL